ncbi:tetratricopeptide repeat protein [Kitasatospora saccharophila]|uniref:tetratricopeptide repeat protein n=1 Tax=Kitasatospora saccharophila TaxID=407973 RepID=UPI00362C45A0
MELLAPALPLARTAGHRWVERVTLTNLGDASLRLGRLADAERFLLEGLSLRPAGPDPRTEGLALLHLGTVYRALGRLPQAVGCLRRALELHDASGDRRARGRVLEQLGHALVALGRPEEAVPGRHEAPAGPADAGERPPVLPLPGAGPAAPVAAAPTPAALAPAVLAPAAAKPVAPGEARVPEQSRRHWYRL